MKALDDQAEVTCVWDAAGREPPVFLDERGRRHRLLYPLGVLAVLATAGWVAALVLGATGFGGLPRVRAALAQRASPRVVLITASAVRASAHPRHLDIQPPGIAWVVAQRQSTVHGRS